jgi:hypothetical protein
MNTVAFHATEHRNWLLCLNQRRYLRFASASANVLRQGFPILSPRIDSAKESFPPIMSKKMASIIVAYGVTLAALSFLAQQSAPAFAKVTFFTGIAGGGLCVLWGIVAFAGYKRRTWAGLTMILVTVALLSQVVQVWLAATDETSINLTGRLVLTLMFLMTIGMLMYLLHGERPPEFYDPGADRRKNPFSHGERPQSPDAGRRR